MRVVGVDSEGRAGRVYGWSRPAWFFCLQQFQSFGFCINVHFSWRAVQASRPLNEAFLRSILNTRSQLLTAPSTPHELFSSKDTKSNVLRTTLRHNSTTSPTNRHIHCDASIANTFTPHPQGQLQPSHAKTPTPLLTPSHTTQHNGPNPHNNHAPPHQTRRRKHGLSLPTGRHNPPNLPRRCLPRRHGLRHPPGLRFRA